jgi:hypothetical protein
MKKWDQSAAGAALLAGVLGIAGPVWSADVASPPAGQIRFDFESGDLQGWKVVDVTLDDVVATGRLDPKATAGRFAKRKRVLPALAGKGSGASDTLRPAVEDLLATFGQRYVGGKAFLARLDAIEKQDAADGADDFLTLQREALLANPLVRGHEIVYVARPQDAAIYHAIDTLFQVGEATAGRFTPGGALKVLDPATGTTRTAGFQQRQRTAVRGRCLSRQPHAGRQTRGGEKTADRRIARKTRVERRQVVWPGVSGTWHELA